MSPPFQISILMSRVTKNKRTGLRMGIAGLLVSVVLLALPKFAGFGQPRAQETQSSTETSHTGQTETVQTTEPETTPSRASSSPVLEVGPTIGGNPSGLKERFLSEKLAIVQEYHGTLIQTVYWALGTVAGTALAVLAFVWIAFNRNFDREKASLQAELLGELQSALAELKTETAQEKETMRKELQKEMSLFQEKTSGRLEAMEKDLSSFENRLDKIGKDASATATKLLLPQINDLRVETAELDMKRWMQEKNWANVISSGATLLERLKEAGKDDFYYQYALFDIHLAVTRIAKLQEHTSLFLDELLSLVPESLSDKRGQIARIAESKKEKPEQES